MALTAAENLAQLVKQKEDEWRHVTQLRIESLEALVEEKEAELADERGKFNKLKEDFKYNLRLLNERHAELDSYDRILAELKRNTSEKDAEVSELKIRLDEFETARQRDGKSREELQLHYQQRLREKQAEVEEYRMAKDAKIHQEREELEAFKRDHDRKICELEEEFELQKREISRDFDEKMKKREHEFRVQSDEMTATVMSHEIKVKLLSNELEIVRAASKEEGQKWEAADDQHRELTKQLKQAQWELQDVTAIKDARINDLEVKLKQFEKSSQRLAEDFNRKYAELDRHVRNKDAALTKVRTAYQEREAELTEKIHGLEEMLAKEQLDKKQLAWEKQDMKRDNEATVERLQGEINDLQSRVDHQVSEQSQATVSRDLELEQARQTVSKLETQLRQGRDDINRYKKELQESVEREAELERGKVQIQLDWQRKYEDAEQVQYSRSEELIKTLTAARDQAQADVQAKSRELEAQEELIGVLKDDRNRAIATLRKHGLTIDHDIEVEEPPPHAQEQITNLQMQNDNLREVIREMRQQMETLGDTIPTHDQPRQTKNDREQDYVRHLENELQQMKAKYRHLQTEHDKPLDPSGVVEDKLGSIDNVMVKTHVESLNRAIGDLRTEKVQLAAQVRKQQLRIQHLEAALEQSTKQPREAQTQVEQLQYEVSAQARRHKVEIGTLNSQIEGLKMQLAEALKEADVYYKANIERNQETTALGNQLSTLKMELAQKRQPLNFGAQELMIQQLEDEIKRLRLELKGVEVPDTLAAPATARTESSGSVQQLEAKLRKAAHHIQSLARQNQQLIEANNRLRAQLKQHGMAAGQSGTRPPPSMAGGDFSRSAGGTQFMMDSQKEAEAGQRRSREISEKIQTKLAQLEQLQYELTKQQLAHTSRPDTTGHVSVMDASSQPLQPHHDDDADMEEDFQPKSILKNSIDKPLLNAIPEGHPVHAVSLPFDAERPLSQQGRPAKLMLSISSVGGESIQEIWKMLDAEDDDPLTARLSSPTPGGRIGLMDDGGSSSGRPSSGESWTLHGKTPVISQKEPARKLTNQKPAVKKTGQPRSKQKIRNYNVRDDKKVAR